MTEKLIVTALITNLTTKDDGFAVIQDSGEGIYIPPGVTRASSLVAGEYRDITIIPNNPDRQERTKWMGIYVKPPATSMPEAHRTSTEDQGPSYNFQALLEDVERLMHTHDYLTTSEVAEEMDVEVMVARDILNRLFNERKVARADVHYGSNKRACNVLWAKSPESFL